MWQFIVQHSAFLRRVKMKSDGSNGGVTVRL
jgi:hypothetical protein